jgi:hypothetical protein
MVVAYDHDDPRPSWSRVKGVLDCPAEARWAAAQHREDSAAMALGRMMHCAILEPGELARRYTVAPEIVRLPEWEWVGGRGVGYACAALPGRNFATKKDAEASSRPWGWVGGPPMMPGPDGEAPGYRSAAEATEALGALAVGDWTDDATLSLVREWGDAARALLPGGIALHAEVPLYGRLEGVECRGCADAIVEHDGGLIIVDVKTARAVDPRSVARSAHDGRWHGQLATYAMLAIQQPLWRHLTIADVTLAVLVVQAPAVLDRARGLRAAPRQPRPHARIEWLSIAATGFGIAQARRAWRLWRDCDATGIWPDHSGGLDVAGWRLAAGAAVEEAPW